MNMNSRSLVDELICSPGYSTRFSLAPDELAFVREVINEQFGKRLSQFTGVEADLTIDRYHEIRIESHSQMWPKDVRFIPPAAVEVIKEFRIFELLKRELGAFEISKRVDQRGHIFNLEEIYWRLVRPNVASDVGPLHADIWFADALNYKNTILGGRETLKLWLPIYVEENKSGLAVVPDSQLRKWDYEIIRNSNGHLRPKIKSDVKGVLVPVQAGQAIIFGENLLHGGVLNQGQYCRVSIEITLLLEQKLCARDGLCAAEGALPSPPLSQAPV